IDAGTRGPPVAASIPLTWIRPSPPDGPVPGLEPGFMLGPLRCPGRPGAVYSRSGPVSLPTNGRDTRPGGMEEPSDRAEEFGPRWDEGRGQTSRWSSSVRGRAPSILGFR